MLRDMKSDIRDALRRSRATRNGEGGHTYTIVGVVGDMRYWGLAKPAVGEVFVTESQASSLAFRSIAFKPRGDANAAIVAVRTAINAADPTIVMSASGTLADRVAAASAPERFRALLVGALAVIALVLAGLGLFAVTAHAVAVHARDIGIRLALGATQTRVRASVLRDAVILGALGTTLGLGLSWAAARGLARFMSDAPGFDVTMCAVVAAVFVIVTGIAAAVPAFRASRVDPLVAMRQER
jgi:ABC-type antimicrobial peptide transport system permease subunit